MKRTPVIEKFEYQPNVASRTTNSPPASPSFGDRYIVPAGAIGGWSGHDHDIAWYDSTIWQFDTPSIGWRAFVEDEGGDVRFNGTVWETNEDTDQYVKADASDSSSGFLESKVDQVDLTVDTVNHVIKVKSGSALEDAKTKAHDQDTDQYIDFGGSNQTSAAEIRAAASKAHDRNKDVYLDQGGSNEVSASDIRAHLDDTTTNPHGITTSMIGAIPASEKGAANGVATLDGDGLVPSSQLPSYVDDVLEYASYSNFPNPGETGKIYVALDTNKTYRWSGSTYIEISSGEVTSVNGKTGVVVLNTDDISEGSTNLYYTDARVSANTDVSANTSARHIRNEDTALDEGGSNEVTAADLRAHLDDPTLHRKIDDITTSSVTLWSSSKIASEISSASDTKKSLVSSGDTTEGYLEAKIIGDSNLISVNKINAGGNEQLQITIGSSVFNISTNDLDDIADGTVYGRVAISELTSNGEVKKLDDGTNEVTAAQAKLAYDSRGVYVPELKAIVFNNL